LSDFLLPPQTLKFQRPKEIAMSTWFRNWVPSRQRPTSARKERLSFRPMLQLLEARDVPAASFTQNASVPLQNINFTKPSAPAFLSFAGEIAAGNIPSGSVLQSAILTIAGQAQSSGSVTNQSGMPAAFTVSLTGTLTTTGLGLPVAGNVLSLSGSQSTGTIPVGGTASFPLINATGNSGPIDVTSVTGTGPSFTYTVAALFSNMTTGPGTNTTSVATEAGATFQLVYNYTTPTTPLVSGDTATIGFWQNKNGQGLIKNATPATSQSLGAYLASTLPHFFGPGSGNDLTNATNDQVAALYVSIFKNGGSPKVVAQIFDAALSTWFTNSTLNAVAPGFGFNYSAGGSGSHTFTVGTGGPVAPGTYTLLQLLQAVDQAKKDGTFDANANSWNDLFDTINSTFDIKG
jgi:hypothetical protein